jgi:hypothetical protein
MHRTRTRLYLAFKQWVNILNITKIPIKHYANSSSVTARGNKTLISVFRSLIHKRNTTILLFYIPLVSQVWVSTALEEVALLSAS